MQTAQGRVGLALFVADMGGRVPHLHLKDHCSHVSLYPRGGETSEAHFEAVSHLAPIYRSLPVAPIFSHSRAPVGVAPTAVRALSSSFSGCFQHDGD